MRSSGFTTSMQPFSRNDWWRDRIAGVPPRARWLGIFRRVLRPFPVAAARISPDSPVLAAGPDRVDLAITDESSNAQRAAAEKTDPDLSILLRPSLETLLTAPGPLEWPAALFDYQLAGVRALLSQPALLLADDMGLGKTVQAIAAIRILFARRAIDHVLVVARMSLLSQWRREFRRWAPELRISTVRGPSADRTWQWPTPAHVHLVGYETLRADFTDNPHSPPRRRTWDVLVLDEAQAIKNRDAEVSYKCKRVPRRRCWALTGTPLENNLDELASVLEAVTPLAAGESPPRLGPGPALHARHKNLQLRRRKADVLPELPPKLNSRVPLALEGPQRESYDRAEREGVIFLREKGTAVRIEHVLELIVRLKQICNFCPRTGRSAKLDDLRHRLGTLVSEGHRALVFSQFVDDRFGVHAVARGLRAFEPMEFTGKLDTAARDACIREFKARPHRKALVLSLRAGGLGLNLQEASYVFHFDRWWNPAVEQQAEDRAHRLGQSVVVNVYHYICENTIEEKIDQILASKRLLFDEHVDGVSIDVPKVLTPDELFGLFGLERSG